MSDKLYISNQDFNNLIQNVLVSIDNSEFKYDGVIAIARGGLTPAHYIASALNIKCIDVIQVQSYNEDNTQGALEFLSVLPALNSNNKYLLIDDLADSGNTFVKVIEELKAHSSQVVIHSVALLLKPQSVFKPTYIGSTLKGNEWVVFPWEVLNFSN